MKVTHVNGHFFRASHPPVEGEEPALTDASDMLRYDVAFVAVDDPTLLAFPIFSGRRGQSTGLGHPTMARWDSFGVGLVEIPRPQQREMAIRFLDEGTRWFTTRHPKKDDGRIDFNRLVKVPLQVYLVAADPTELP